MRVALESMGQQVLEGKVQGNLDIKHLIYRRQGFPTFPGKETACNAGDLGSIPGSGRSLGEENGYPLQYSCLGNSVDRGA